MNAMESVPPMFLNEGAVQIESLHRTLRIKSALCPFCANLTVTWDSHSKLERFHYGAH
jgi:hypothetical protein